MLALAATIALLAFLGGFLAGQRGESFSTVRSIPMHGTGLAQNASATIDLGDLDASGNWPLRVELRNLPGLPRGGYYEMFLTKNGKPAASCGAFAASGSSSTVRLNAPYDLRRFNGWVVTMERPGSPAHQVMLTTA